MRCLAVPFDKEQHHFSIPNCGALMTRHGPWAMNATKLSGEICFWSSFESRQNSQQTGSCIRHSGGVLLHMRSLLELHGLISYLHVVVSVEHGMHAIGHGPAESRHSNWPAGHAVGHGVHGARVDHPVVVTIVHLRALPTNVSSS